LGTASRIIALASYLEDICIGFHSSFFASILTNAHLETLIILCFHRTSVINLVHWSLPIIALPSARSSTIESAIEANQISIDYLSAT
jgi:hypothetical protein